MVLDTSVFWVVCFGLVAAGGFGVGWFCGFVVVCTILCVVGVAFSGWCGDCFGLLVRVLVLNAVHVNLVIWVLGLMHLWLVGLCCAGLVWF